MHLHIVSLPEAVLIPTCVADDFGNIITPQIGAGIQSVGDDFTDLTSCGVGLGPSAGSCRAKLPVDKRR